MKEKRYKDEKRNDWITRHIQENLNNIPICCFSEKPENILMWSHYADKHQGICLKFDAKSKTTFFGEALKVKYQKEYPIINAFTDTDEQQSEKAILTKAKFWKYEAEWRIIFVGKKHGVFPFPGKHLRGIILGANISDGDRLKVMQWVAARKNPIQIYKATYKKNKYGIEINETKS